MMTRGWKLIAVYLCAFGLGIMTAAVYATDAVTSFVERPAPVALGVQTLDASQVATTHAAGPLLMSAAEMSATLGAGWWDALVDLLGDVAQIAAFVITAELLAWLCSRENVSCG